MKKYLAFILAVCMLLSVCCVAASEENSYSSESYNLLKTIDIVESNLEGKLLNGVTRSEASQMIAKFMGSGELPPTATEFTDVTADNKFSGYVNFLYSHGVVSLNEAKTFSPDRFVTYEESVKMVISALGGNEVAELSGGYPTGYLSLASSEKIIDGLNTDKFITLSALCDILYKALNVPLFTENNYSITDSGVLSEITVNKNDTALNTYLDITVLKANIISEDIKKNSLAAKIYSVGKKSASFEYSAGESVNLLLSEKITAGNFRYTDNELWVKGDNNLVYISPLADTEILWGAVCEINKETKEGENFDIRYIENVALYGHEDYMDIAENCRFFYNGKEVKEGGIAPIGNFSRAVLKDDEITSLEIWELNEGGVITDTSAGFVYSKGIETNIFFNPYDECKTITAIINNQFQSKFMFKKGMLFDWFYDEKSGDLLIVSSGISKTDVLTGVSKTDGVLKRVLIGEDSLDVSARYGVYCKKDNDAFNTATIDDLMGETVTAYSDYKGEVRYLEVFIPAMSDNEFYGIVLGCKINGLDDDEIKIARITENGPEINEYKTKYKLNNANSGEPSVFPAGIDIQKIVSTINNADNKNYEMKKAQVLYKFKLNNQGKVLKAELPTLFDKCAETGETPSEISGNGAQLARISYKIVFERTVPVCAYYYDDGEMKIEVATAGDLVGKSITDCQFHFYSKGDTSDIEFIFLRGNAKSICNAAYENASYDIMTEHTEAYDAKADKMGHNLTIGGVDYFMTGDETENIPGRALVKYGTSPVFGDNEISLLDVVDLSGKPSAWDIKTGTVAGLHKGTIQRFDNMRLYTEDGRFYYDENVIVYKIRPDGKIVNAARNELISGETIYYYLGSVVEVIIIEE